MRAWRWYRDEEVQRPNKPLQQTKLRFAAEWQALGRNNGPPTPADLVGGDRGHREIVDTHSRAREIV